MKLYFAPMEGVAGYIYRNTQNRHFGGADTYFSPFLVPRETRKLTPKEAQDVLPEHNRELLLVPQILANQPESFLWAAKEMEDRGYDTVNLNLGCPSGTVVSKGRGAGFLASPEELDRFLERILRETRLAISVKTRLGMERVEEFPRLLEIFNRYPFRELIIHPRVRSEYYRKTPHREVFAYACRNSRNPLYYNGDVFTAEDYREIAEAFPEISGVMLGRGILANPGLLREIRTGSSMTKEELYAFLEDLCGNYQAVMSGDAPTLFKMKELWFYMGYLFTDSGKYLKKIKKAGNLAEYKAAVDALFAEQELIPGAGFPGTP